MKIEKVNENTIRCTLTSEELISRQIRISELCYGTDKIKALFRDMMIQARNDLGFDIRNVPLMIEAVPTPDALVLVITKVEDPEELDTRFSRFSPGGTDVLPPPDLAGADNMLSLFNKLKDARKLIEGSEPKGLPGGSAGPAHTGRREQEKAPSAEIPEPPIDMIRAFRFRSLDDLIRASKVIGGRYAGDNVLFRTDSAFGYQLMIHSRDVSPEEFNKVCNILSEYGQNAMCTPAAEYALREHGLTLIGADALGVLSTM